MKPRVRDYPAPPRRSQRRSRAKPTKSSAYCAIMAEDNTAKIHEDMLLTQTVKWLNDTFTMPQRTCDEQFVAYYDLYAKNQKRLERLCFDCKYPVDFVDSFICSSLSCVKIFHTQCLPKNHHSHLCPLHFCADCKSRVKEGRYCFMCPTTYCTTCSLHKQKGGKHMSLCEVCTKQCCDGHLPGVMNDCLSCKTITTA